MKTILSALFLLFTSSLLAFTNCINDFSLAWSTAEVQYAADLANCPTNTSTLPSGAIVIVTDPDCGLAAIDQLWDKQDDAIRDYNCCTSGGC